MATTAVSTAGDLCTAALRLATVVSKYEAASSEDMAVAIRALQNMLKAWQIPGIKMYSRERLTPITVTDAASSYTLGSRVLYIETANWVDSAGTETYMSRLTASEYDELSDKDSAGRATSFYHDRQRESSVVYVWPVLATAGGETIKLTVQSEIEDITATTDTVEIPAEGYEAVEYNLAKRMLQAFQVKDPIVNQTIRADAREYYETFVAGEREDSVFFSPDYRGFR